VLVAQGVDPISAKSTFGAFAVMAVPSIAMMAAKKSAAPNPWLVGSLYALAVGEMYRLLTVRTYKYNMGHRNGL
jgi:hypothetical protein